jgi:hypothetical protein
MNEVHQDVLIAIVAYAAVRYYLPKTILKQKMNLNEVVVLSVCYGLTIYARQYMKKKLEEKDSLS